VGIQQQEFANQCLDTAYLKRHPENRNALLNLPGYNSSKLSFDIYYTSYYITGTRYFPLTNKTSFYTSGGLTSNYVHPNSGPSGTNIFFDSKNNETLELRYSSAHNYYGMVAEGGFNFLLFNDHITFYTGFRFNTGFKKVVDASYTDTQNNTVINTDHISTNGTYMGFICTLGLNLFSMPEPIHINPPSITLPRIGLPHITLQHADKNKKEHIKRKHRKHPIVQTPRFIIQ
jgi:hypothetical protein